MSLHIYSTGTLIVKTSLGMFRIPNVPWSNWNSYLEGGGHQGEEIVKSTLFCKVHYVLNSDIKIVFFIVYFLPLGSTSYLFPLYIFFSRRTYWMKHSHGSINNFFYFTSKKQILKSQKKRDRNTCYVIPPPPPSTFLSNLQIYWDLHDQKLMFCLFYRPFMPFYLPFSLISPLSGPLPPLSTK